MVVQKYKHGDLCRIEGAIMFPMVGVVLVIFPPDLCLVEFHSQLREEKFQR